MDIFYKNKDSLNPISPSGIEPEADPFAFSRVNKLAPSIQKQNQSIYNQGSHITDGIYDETLDGRGSSVIDQSLQPIATPRLTVFKRQILAGATALLLTLLAIGALTIYHNSQSSKTKLIQSAELPTQKVQLSAGFATSGPIKLDNGSDTAIINGDLFVRGSLRFYGANNKGNYFSFDNKSLTAIRTYQLPDAGGVLCLSTNNCGYATTAELSNLASTVRLLNGDGTTTIVNEVGVNSLNNLQGALTLQGTGAQINVTSGAGVVTLSLPQNIATTSSPAFNSIALSTTGTQNGFTLCDSSNNCGYASTGSGTGDVNQGGNNFGVAMTLGTIDNFGLNLKTNNITVASFTPTGAVIFKNSADSTEAFQVQNNSGQSILNLGTMPSSDAGNLIANPSFETNTNGWAPANSGTLNRVTSQSYLGQASMQINTNATALDGAIFAYNVSTGTTYTLSGYIKSGTGASLFQIGYWTGSTNPCNNFQTITTTGWTRFTCTFNVSSIGAGAGVVVQQTTATASTFYVDGLRLEVGSNATSVYDSDTRINGQLGVAGAINSDTQFNLSGVGVLTKQPNGAAIVGDLSGNLRGSYSIDIQGSRIDSFTGLLDPAFVASGTRAIAIGSEATASGASSIAIGWQVVASGLESSAVGRYSTAPGFVAQSFGYQSSATGSGSLAYGNRALAAGSGSTAIGGAGFSTSKALGANSFSAGNGSIASGNDTLAVGKNTRVGNIYRVFTVVANGTVITIAGGDYTSEFVNGDTVIFTENQDYHNLLSITKTIAAVTYNAGPNTTTFNIPTAIDTTTTTGRVVSQTRYLRSGAFGYTNVVTATDAFAFGSNITNTLQGSVMLGSNNSTKLTLNSSGYLGILNTSPGNRLSINVPTTTDSLAQALISTGVATNKGIVIQAVASQSANLLELQNSTANILSGFDSGGQLFLGRASGLTGSLKIFNSSGSGNISIVPANPGASIYTLTLPAETGTVCTTGSVCSGYASSASAYIQGGNSFGATAVLGTNDSNSLSFETNNITQATIAVGGAVTFQNSVDSATGFQIKNAAGDSLFNLDTTGNSRGAGSLDLQTSRANSSQVASGAGSIAIGANNSATTVNTIAIGTGNTASAAASYFSNAYGSNNTATGTQTSNAFGSSNIASGALNADAFGSGNTASSFNATAFGMGNIASNVNSSAVGQNNNATGQESWAYGRYNNALAFASGAYGGFNGAYAQSSSAFGYSNNGVGFNSAAIGNSNNANGVNANAAGVGNVASGSYSSAIGVSSRVGGTPRSYTISAGGTALTIAGGNYTTEFVNGDTVVLTDAGSAGHYSDIASVTKTISAVTYNVGPNTTTFTLNSAINGTTTSGKVVNQSIAQRSGAVGYTNVVTASDAYAFGSNIVNALQGSVMIGTADATKLTLNSSGYLGILNTTPGNRLSINTLTTADSLAQIAVSTGITTNKGIVIQGVASQTADLLQLQDSSGNVLSKFASNGALTIRDYSTTTAAQLLTVRQNGSPTANTPIIDLQNSSGISIFNVDSEGDVTLQGNGTISSSNGLYLKNAQSDTGYSVITNNGKRLSVSTHRGLATALYVEAANISDAGIIVRATSSQTANIFITQDSSGNAQSGFDTGGQLFLGRASSLTGTSTYYNASGAGKIILQGNNPGASTYTLNLPAENGTLCSTGSVCTGYAPSATNGYVQLAPAAAQTDSTTNSSININKTGASGNIVTLQNNGTTVNSISNTGAVLFQNNADSTTAFQIQNATGTSNTFVVDTLNSRIGIGKATPNEALDVTGSIATGGNYKNAVGLSGGYYSKTYTVGTGGVIANEVVVIADDGGSLRAIKSTTARDSRVLGVAAEAANSGSNAAIAIAGNYTVAVDNAAVSLGDQLVVSTTSGKATVDNNATTGIVGIALSTKSGGSNGTVSVAVRPVNGQYSPIFRNASDSTSALQIQNAAGANLVQVDSTNSNITLLGNNSGELQAWQTNANALPATRNGAATTTANGYLYLAGGGAGGSSTVYYGKLQSNGSVGAFSTNANALPATRKFASAATANGYIYVVGGSTDGTAANVQSTVYYAKLYADGSTGTWTSNSQALTTALDQISAVVANGYIYVVGGRNSASSVVSTVYYAKLNADGSTGTWTTSANSLPAARNGTATVVANGYLYVSGGGGSPTSAVYYARLNSDGTTGAFSTNANNLPTGRNFSGSVVANGYLYIIGGGGGGSPVYYAQLNSNGSTGTWSTATNTLPNVRSEFQAVSVNGYIYVAGGYDGSLPTSTVYYASTSRLMVGGSLDLVGLTGQALSDTGSSSQGSGGGSITAGNGYFVGSLDVAGAVNFGQGVSIGGNLTNNGSGLFKNSTDSATAFQIQNAAGTSNLFVADTTNSRIGIGKTPSLATLDINGTLVVTSTGGGNVATIAGTNAGGSVALGLLNSGAANASTTVDITTVQENRNGGKITFGRENSLNWAADITRADGYIAFSPVLNGVNNEVFRLSSDGAARFLNIANSNIAFQIQNSTTGTNGNLFLANTLSVNTLWNPSFEVDTSSWAVNTGAGSVARNTSEKLYGNASMAVTTTTTANSGAKYDTASTLSASTTYSLSFWAKIGSGSFTVEAGRSDTDAFGGETTCTLSSATVNTNWNRYTCTFTTSGSITTGGYIFIRQSDSTARTFYVDGVQLEVAGAATTYQEGKLQFNGLINSPTTFQNQANSTAAFQIQNAAGTDIFTTDTSNSRVTVRGINSTAILGSELLSSSTCSGTNWSGSGTGPYTHTAGSAVVLNCTPPASVTSGATYLIEYSVTGSITAGEFVTPSLGGTSGRSIGYQVSNQSEFITTSSTSGWSFGPTSNFNGSVTIISIKQLTQTTNSTINISNSDASTAIEIRSGGPSLKNTFIGFGSGTYNTSGSNNTAIGYQSLVNNTVGTSNTSVGYQSLYTNTSGNQNSSFGQYALQLSSNGSDNAAFGYRALQNNISGSQNTSIGSLALYSNTTGLNNTAIGYSALRLNAQGNENVGIGNLALGNATEGNNNIAIGTQALSNLTTNSNSVAIGYQALTTTTGSNNTALGYRSGYNDLNGFTPITSVQNTATIGAYSLAQASNSLILGGAGSAAVNVGIGTTAPSDLFSVSPVYYSTGTASQTASTTVVGSGTTWTSSMVGMEFIYADGTKDIVQSYTDATHLVLGSSRTISSQAYRIHNRNFYVTNTGSAALRTSTDSTTAFQIQNTAGTSMFTVDTSNIVIKIGGSTTTFATLLIDNAHFRSTQTNTPTIGTPTNCGTSPSAAVTSASTDSAGSFTITAGTGSPTTCDVVFTFNKAYGAAPKSILITPTTAVGSATGAKAGVISASSTTTFTIQLTTNPAASEVNSFYYWVVE